MTHPAHPLRLRVIYGRGRSKSRRLCGRGHDDRAHGHAHGDQKNDHDRSTRHGDGDGRALPSVTPRPSPYQQA